VLAGIPSLCIEYGQLTLSGDFFFLRSAQA
jgi:hypothetical protein